MNYKQIILEAEKEFDEQFKGWKTTKSDLLGTGDIEQIQTSDTPMVVGNREELKQFQSSQISKAYEEGRKSNISEVLKDILDERCNNFCGCYHCIEVKKKIKNLGIEIK